MKRTSRRVAAAVLLLAASAPAAEPSRLQHTDPGFLLAEFTASTAVALSLSLTPGAETCHWCVPPAFDADIRSALVARDGRPAATVSHVLALGVAPALGIAALTIPAANSEHPSYALADSVIVLNATVLVSGIGDFTKKVTARERPAYHYGHEHETEVTPTARYRSFFSLDTAWAFTIAGSAATLAVERGYWTAPWLAGAGAAVGVTTGVLRIVADMHYASDVLTGALVGTGAGIAFPLLLHPPVDTPLRVAVVPITSPEFFGVAGVGVFR